PSFARHAGMTQARPTLQRVKAQTAFITKPTLVHVDIPAADGPVNLSIAGCITGNAAANRSGRMINTKVATGTAAGANRIRTFEKPYANFEAKISARQGADRTSIDYIHRIRISQRKVFKNANLGIVPTVENLNLVRLRHIAREPDATRA